MKRPFCIVALSNLITTKGHCQPLARLGGHLSSPASHEQTLAMSCNPIRRLYFAANSAFIATLSR
jgi:hypothetical protein